MMKTLTIAGSGTPVEKEYRAIAGAMNKCTRSVHAFDAKTYDVRAV